MTIFRGNRKSHDRSWCAAACALALVALFTGCGSGKVKTYPVTVKLILPGGPPLEGAIIVFQSIPDAALNNGDKPVSAVGKIGADGTCQLSTFSLDDGAVAGKHHVTVSPSVSSTLNSTDPKGQARLIHAIYQKPETSGLEATVSPDGPNIIPIEIKRR